MKQRPTHLIGKTFGRLTLLGYTENNDAKCICSCKGKEVIIKNFSSLKSGGIRSCGCLRSTSNGMSNTKVYNVWRGILQRCNNQKCRSYKNYGGRGIIVCDRWGCFNNFFADMGHPPEGASIDRIDNNGNYEPGNCRWATNIEQCNNARKNRILTYNNESHTVAEWSRILKLPYGVLMSRITRGNNDKKAITLPHYGRYGTDHHKAKLTEKQVIKIWNLHYRKGVGKRRLSKQFNVDTHTIRDILSSKTWSHVTNKLKK